MSKYTGWGLSEIKEMEIEELAYWLKVVERMAENELRQVREPVF